MSARHPKQLLESLVQSIDVFQHLECDDGVEGSRSKGQSRLEVGDYIGRPIKVEAPAPSPGPVS